MQRAASVVCQDPLWVGVRLLWFWRPGRLLLRGFRQQHEDQRSVPELLLQLISRWCTNGKGSAGPWLQCPELTSTLDSFGHCDSSFVHFSSCSRKVSQGVSQGVSRHATVRTVCAHSSLSACALLNGCLRERTRVCLRDSVPGVRSCARPCGYVSRVPGVGLGTVFIQEVRAWPNH
jgi:hypothetical protein